jgi:hypothetical protein
MGPEILERFMRRSDGEGASLCEAQAEKAAMLQCNPAFLPQRNTTGQIGAETALPSGNTVLVGVDIPEELVLVLVRTVVYAIFLLSVLSDLMTASSRGQWRWKTVTFRIAGGPKALAASIEV